MVAMHQMRDSFQVLKEHAEWGYYEQENGDFYDGYAEAKRIFGDVLLQRDTQPEKDEKYWEEVERAVGKGTRSILWGTSTRSLRRALAR
jgi:hypothetical protein